MLASLGLWLLEQLSLMGVKWAIDLHTNINLKKAAAAQRADEHAATAVADAAETHVEQERANEIVTDTALRHDGPGTDGTGGSLRAQANDINADIDQR